MTIAVDFDGTIVEHRYPAIGKEKPFAVAAIKQLIDEGHRFILWSVREGELLEEAVKWCEERGIMFVAVNRDYAEEKKENNEHFSRKLKVDLFIDDRNVGGLPDWGVIYECIHHRISFERYYSQVEHPVPEPRRKKHWWSF